MNTTYEQLVQVAPLADIEEVNDKYILSIDMPGMKKEDIRVTLENGNLVVSGKPTFPIQSKELVENFAKEYFRTFSLGNDIDASSIEAQYEFGVVSVTLAKKPQYKPKQIFIQ